MAKVAGKNLSPIYLYNPAILSRDELERLFLVRREELRQVLGRLDGEGPSANPILLLGERGSGKTTLLARIAYALDESPGLRYSWLPIRFDEEQYNVGSLADLWLNCLEKIAEDTGDIEPLRMVDRLHKEYGLEELEEVAFLSLHNYSLQKGLRLLLLVDNLDVLFSHLDSDRELHRLRELLQSHQQSLSLIGSSSGPILETFHYGSPFYEFFEVVHLRPLTYGELIALFRGLGSAFNKSEMVEGLVGERAEILRFLHILTEGNLRRATLLFSILMEHPTTDVLILFDHLLDQYTSLYKERIESLPSQAQRVLDALACFWNPATAEQIAEKTRIGRGVASGQLHRLVERQIVEKVRLPQRSIGFRVRDRFFNLWYLMRAGRRQRRVLYSLVSFMGLFFRDGRPSGRFERLILRLERMGLVDDREVFLARQRAAKLVALNSLEQLHLFGYEESSRVHLLALYCCEDYQEALRMARALLEMGGDETFLRIILADLLEGEGVIEDALAVIEEDVMEEMSPWLQLEQARMRIHLERMDRIEELFVPATQFKDLPAREVAKAVAALAREGGESIAWALYPLLMSLKSRASEEFTVPLASCYMELALKRNEEALASFREVLRRDRQNLSSEEAGDILDLAMSLAATGLKGELLRCLEEEGLAEEWLPLSHALAYLGDDPSRLERLAPEIRALTEIVVGRIEDLRSRS